MQASLKAFPSGWLNSKAANRLEAAAPLRSSNRSSASNIAFLLRGKRIVLSGVPVRPGVISDCPWTRCVLSTMRNATVNQPPTRADSSMTENLAAGQEMLHERGADLYAYYLRSLLASVLPV